MSDSISLREDVLKNCKQIVVKAGTRLLTDTAMIAVLIRQIAMLRDRGYKVMLVSSGAVGVGMKTLGLEKRPAKLASKQALAAIGQNKLMTMYQNECHKHGFHSAQLLLTADDLKDRKRHLNVMNCIDALWAENILPVINENDCVSVDELKFGDNDTLAGLLAAMTRSELTIILTTVGGLHYKENNILGERISVVENITDELREMATGTDDSALSVGGMISKLNAADIVTAAGDHLLVADGREADIIDQILDGKDVGTLFLPQQKSKSMQSKKRWISFFSKPAGTITVDGGAVTALCDKGRSLLSSGITGVSGEFDRGDTVDIADCSGNVFARGLTNYSFTECSSIKGLQSSEIAGVLYPGQEEELMSVDNEVVHRNNLVILTANG